MLYVAEINPRRSRMDEWMNERTNERTNERIEHAAQVEW